jgi:hypothetical protein
MAAKSLLTKEEGFKFWGITVAAHIVASFFLFQL